ncbi:protein of unknown function [Burkholderia multivorans]
MDGSGCPFGRVSSRAVHPVRPRIRKPHIRRWIEHSRAESGFSKSFFDSRCILNVSFLNRDSSAEFRHSVNPTFIERIDKQDVRINI